MSIFPKEALSKPFSMQVKALKIEFYYLNIVLFDSLVRRGDLISIINSLPLEFILNLFKILVIVKSFVTTIKLNYKVTQFSRSVTVLV